jgi:hypothetical protein
MVALPPRYEVVAEIKNEGGRALYRAHDTQLDHEVALKIVEFDGQQSRDRLFSEVKILLRLEAHAALPTMREGFELDKDRYAIVMDWINGQNLADVLSQRGAPGLPSKEVVEYVRQVAAALDHLHGQDPAIVHGDVKPSNLVRTPSGKVVLIDFGIAHQVGASVDAGTRGYVAPEVWRGEPSTPAADVFGLAATAYALLTGAPPDHTQPPDLDPDPVVGAHLLGALKQGLVTDPGRRPRTAGALADRLAAGNQALPSGVVTFLALELVATDEFFDSDDEEVEELRDRLWDLLTTTIEQFEGRSLRGQADSQWLDAVFVSSSKSGNAAIALHERVAGMHVPSEFGVMARVALHTGDVQVRNGAYSGAIVSRARRSLTRTAPGCTLVSQTTAPLIRGNLPRGARLVEQHIEGTNAAFLLLAPGAEAPMRLPPAPRLSSPAEAPAHAALNGTRLDDLDAERNRVETLADLALRSAHRFREAGDDRRAEEYEQSAEAFANRAIRIRREIDELEGRGI